MTTISTDCVRCSTAPSDPHFGSRPFRRFAECTNLVDERAVTSVHLEDASFPNFMNWDVREDLFDTNLCSTDVDLTSKSKFRPISPASAIPSPVFQEIVEAAKTKTLRNLFAAIKDPNITKEGFKNVISSVKDECGTLDIQYPDCWYPFTSTYRTASKVHVFHYADATPLSQAAVEAQRWKIEKLIQSGASRTYPNKCDGLTPYLISLNVGREPSVSQLLSGKVITDRSTSRDRESGASAQRRARINSCASQVAHSWRSLKRYNTCAL